MIVAVRFHGSAQPPLALSEGRRIFTIGSGACDLVVPAELARDVAPIHATIERVEGGIMVRETSHAHGLYRSPRAARAPELLLHPGAVGWIGGCPLLALDHRFATLRPRLAWSMGLDAHAAVDEAIGAVADGTPLALVGPRGLDALPLARAIHDATAGDRAFVVGDTSIPPIAGVDGTIVVDLDRVRRVGASQVAAMLAARCAARVIFLASTPRAVRRHLDVYADRVRAVELTPLARRGPEIARLLALVWRDELGSDRSTDAIGPRSLRGLAAYSWPRNLDELRAMATRILAYTMHPSLRRAARSLGVKHQTLAAHLRRIGVEIIDQADRELALPPRSERTAP